MFSSLNSSKFSPRPPTTDFESSVLIGAPTKPEVMEELTDNTLDRYIWAALVKQETLDTEDPEGLNPDLDLPWEVEEDQDPEAALDLTFKTEETDELAYAWPEVLEESAELPNLDGQVPDLEIWAVEEVVAQEEADWTYYESPKHESEDWALELELELSSGQPLLQDTWVGVSSRPTTTTAYTEVLWPLEDKPLCAVFVGPEDRSTLLNANASEDYRQHPNLDQIFNQPSTIAQTSNSFQPIYPPTFVSSDSQHNANFDSPAQYFNPTTVSTSDFSLTSTSAIYGQAAHFENGNDFERLLNIDEHAIGSSNGLDQQLYEPLSAPNSTYSFSTSSPWSGHDSYTSDSSGMSQDDILEEIQRECAEIEERQSSASPPDSHPPKLKKKVSTRHSRRATAEPYAMAPSTSSRVSKQPKQLSLSPSDLFAGGNDKKKELNRIAATKYREKKRIERESIKGELKTLEARNTELRTEVNSMESEIKYLKGLIKEIESRTSRR